MPDGAGWTDIHVIREPDTPYDLPVDGLAADLEAIMPRVRRFSATAMGAILTGEHDPLGHYETDAHCYGFDQDCYLKLQVEDRIIRRIVFDCATVDPDRIVALRRAIAAVDAHAPSIIADYWVNAVGVVANPLFMDAYFAHLKGA